MPRQSKSRSPDQSAYTLDLRKALVSDKFDGRLEKHVVHPHAERDLNAYVAIHENREKKGSSIIFFFRKTAHIAFWGIRLVMPSFLVGHPSLWDNLQALWKNPQFKPLRALGLGWLIFALAVGSAGTYVFVHALQTKASGGPYIQTGYYEGNGTTLTITGLTFTPQVVIIKADTTAGAAVIKTSAMPAGEYGYLAAAADNTENQITLTSTGFTVGSRLEVNTTATRYIWIAFGGSNCTSGGELCVSSYSGNGAASQSISTGFQPDLIWVIRPTAANSPAFRTSAMSTNYLDFFTATAQDTTGLITTINSTGFTVTGATNALLNYNAGLYYFIAFKAAANWLTVGQYTGDGTVGRTISGIGFTPNFVLTKAANAATAPAFNITQTWGDYSSLTTAAANITGAIQSLNSGNFVISNSANTNTSATPYDYFAFGGAAAPAPAGSFTMRRGSYTGNGTSQTISSIGFSPDLVMIKSDNSADYAVWSTSMDANLTHYFAVATAGFANGITGMVSNGFSVGSNSAVNTNGITYEYTAFGNATSPQNGAQAQDFIVGAYTGNALATRTINDLGIAPDLVVTKENSTQVGAWRSSTMATNTGAMFSAAADDTTGIYFQTLNSDGFTVGGNAIVNAAGVLYNFFAFKQGAGTFNVGSYAGTGATTTVTGLGLTPDLVWDKATSSVRAESRSSSGTITGITSQVFLNTANITSALTGFVSNGFQVGPLAEVNTVGNSYRYAAWKASGATSSPNTPTNSSPANAATGVDLLAPLSASAYSDPNNNAQSDTQWQVDDANDFNTPVWTRDAGGAEASTIVNTSNGTFASTLLGDNELNHNTQYWWRVRYSNGVWSSWSAPTSFTTNAIVAPTNSSPVNGTTTTTLSPLLMASAFSDPEAADTAANAEWQINTGSNFSSPYYDSGAISYSNSFSVPAAILSNMETYYWQVRYQDQTGQWSAYSTPTRFFTSQSSIAINPLFSNTLVNQGDSLNIDVQIQGTNGAVITDATAAINIYNPSGSQIVSGARMTYLAGSEGVYRYTYTVPAVNGSYLYEVVATENSNTGYGAGNFQVKTLSSDITSLNTNLNNASTTLANEINSGTSTLASQLNSASSSLASQASTNASANSSSLSTINSNVASVNSNVNTANTTLNTVNAGVSSANTSINTINTNVNTANTDINTANGNITNASTTLANELTAASSSLASQTSADTSALSAKLDAANATLNSLNTNLDILIGALIVDQSSVNDPSPSASSFATNLPNSADNFYQNAVLTFTSGSLLGQSRRISAYVGSTKTVTLDPALSSAPSNGDDFTVVAQDTYAEEQAASIASTTNALYTTTNSIASTTNDIETKVTAISSLLQSVDTNIDTLQTTVNTIRTSQQLQYNAELSGPTQAAAGSDYKTTLAVTDFESQPADASSTPTITIYDPTMLAVISSASMTRSSTGLYTYSYTIPSDTTAGMWETVVTVPLGSGSQTKTSYWQVTGAPAQVIINDMSSLVVPNISADITITNEGNAGYEYQYTYCVVPNQSDQCTDPDVIASATAAKLIQPGDNFTPTLSLTVPNPGNYWFKISVFFGTQSSAASRSFTAVTSLDSGGGGGGGSGGGSGGSSGGSSGGGSGGLTASSGGGLTAGSPDATAIFNQLELNSSRLASLLKTVGTVDPTSPGFQSLLQIDQQNTQSVEAIQDKVSDLDAISSTLHDIAAQTTAQPVVQSYMDFGSVDLHFLITNPSSQSQMVPFKALLPIEVKPEDIVDADGLTVAYDTASGAYAVSADITLDGGQSVTKTVKMNDIWVFAPADLAQLASQAQSFITTLAKTQYGAQASLLNNDIVSQVSQITQTQAASYDTPADHIVTYRSNQSRFTAIQNDISQLKDLMTQSGASEGLLGNIGNIETFATWGIILAVAFGFCVMAAIIFAMWRNQMALTALATGMDKNRVRNLMYR